MVMQKGDELFICVFDSRAIAQTNKANDNA